MTGHHWRAKSGAFTLCGLPAASIDRDKMHHKEKSAHLINCDGCKNRRKPPKETQRPFLKKRGVNLEADWTGKCDACGQSPVVPATGMCGPCTFGEADTVGGNW